MSQEQPRRNQQQQQGEHGEEGIKYGDVFPVVAGNLARQPVAPRDAAMMQSAETMLLGQTQKGGAAAAMQSVAAQNEHAGVVDHGQGTGATRDVGVTVTETFVPGGRIITEFVAGQVVGQHVAPGPGDAVSGGPAGNHVDECSGGSKNREPINITIGEALEAAGISAHDKPVEQSDAAAIQAAEARAIGLNVTMPGGVAAQARSAADANLWANGNEDRAKLGDVLSDASVKLPADKAVEKDDAARVVGAEIRNKEDARTAPGGVAAAMAAAARLNERAT